MNVWKWPMVIGIVTAVGLVAGLLSDEGVGDVLAWIGLAVPVGTAVTFTLRRGSES